MPEERSVGRPRVLIIENGVAVTGGVISIVRAASALSDQFEFLFLLPAGSLAKDYITRAGFAVCQMRMRELRRNLMSVLLYVPTLLRNARKLTTLVREQRVDLIHSNDFYNLLPAVYRIFGGRRKYVCHIRFRPSRFPAALRWTLLTLHERYASVILVVSEAVRTELPSGLGTVLIHDFPPTDSRPAMRYNPESRAILYLSNYIPGKGHAAAIEAFSKIYKNFPDWQLRFVGGDMGLKKNREYKSHLLKMAESLRLEGRVEWNEFSETIREEFSSSSFLLNFSESESFSLTCLEALYYGVPVVATASGGPQEFVQPGVNGMLVRVNNIDDMTAAMTKMISDPDLRSAMAMNAFAECRKKFDPAVLAGALAGVYRSLIGAVAVPKMVA